MITPELVTERFLLACLDVDQVTEEYRMWMVDPQVNQFLETRHGDHSVASLRGYVSRMRTSADSYLFGIFTRDRDQHIGNIKLGPVSHVHGSAAIGLVIGERSMWGKGAASEVIGAVATWALGELGLDKLTAGSYASNAGSVRAFQRNGFVIEGIQRSQVRLVTGARDDVVLLGRTRADSGEDTK